MKNINEVKRSHATLLEAAVFCSPYRDKLGRCYEPAPRAGVKREGPSRRNGTWSKTGARARARHAFIAGAPAREATELARAQRRMGGEW